MGEFVTDSTVDGTDIFPDGDKSPAPGIRAKPGWTTDNYVRATEANAIRDALLDLRDAHRGRVFDVTKDWGGGAADKTGAVSASAAIQAAIDAIGSDGGVLFFPPGTYLLTDHDSDGYCIVARRSVTILGSGPFHTYLRPSDALSASVDIVGLVPMVGDISNHTTIAHLTIGKNGSSSRAGRHGIYASTLDAGQNLGKLQIRDVNIEQGAGNAFKHENDAADNINGALYCSLIEQCTLKGGIHLEQSGDSNVIRENIITGTGQGIYAALVSGASLLSIIDNNITSSGSAIKIDNGLRTHIHRNNIEHYTAGGASDAAVININSAAGTFVAGVISENLVSAYGATDATRLIRIREARGTSIEDNVLMSGAAGVVVGIDVASSQDVRIGANSYANLTTKVSDSATGTMGISKTPTLVNGWVAYSSNEAPFYTKSPDGEVSIIGSVKSGTVTSGTIITTLPVGMRPAAGIVHRFPVYSLDPGVLAGAYVLVDEDGNVTCGSVGNTLLCLNGVRFRASTGADSVATG